MNSPQILPIDHLSPPSKPDSTEIPSSATAAKIALSASHAALRAAPAGSIDGSDKRMRSGSTVPPEQLHLVRASSILSQRPESERSPNEDAGLTATLQQADAMRAAQESAIQAQQVAQKAAVEHARVSSIAEVNGDPSVSLNSSILSTKEYR